HGVEEDLGHRGVADQHLPLPGGDGQPPTVGAGDGDAETTSVSTADVAVLVEAVTVRVDVVSDAVEEAGQDRVQLVQLVEPVGVDHERQVGDGRPGRLGVGRSATPD